MSEKHENVVEKWFLEERGIKAETLRSCKVETSDTEARYNIGGRVKVRTGFYNGERKFRYETKGTLALWNLPVKQAEIRDPVIVCEGETDAMRLWQDGGKHKYGMISAMPGCDAITKEMAERLKQLANGATIYFVLDNDKPAKGGGDGAYNPDDWKQANEPVRSVDDSWRRVKALLPKARRIYLPADYKDICEYLNVYSVKDFDGFVVNAEARYNFEHLNLAQPSEAPEYLWQDVVPQSQFVLIQGDMGMGKSMIYQALAVRLANGDPAFLDRRLNPTRDGRVLIVDEENPEAVIRHRLSQLGLRPENQRKLHIIAGRGVRLDNPQDADKLYEDVENFNPDLVCLDSFVRLHMQDENSSSAISAMYNNAVSPLSRQLGAAIILLHHTKKTNSGDSRDRTRGSTDISAGVDQAWDVVDKVLDGGGGTYKYLSRFKTRTGAIGGKDISFKIEDTEDGHLKFPLVDDKGIL